VIADLSIFVIRPHRGGWQCFEAPGVQPYFIGADAKRQAIDYARNRTAHRVGEIRIMNARGDLEETISYDGRRRS
jgi:hypothetical protein